MIERNRADLSSSRARWLAIALLLLTVTQPACRLVTEALQRQAPASPDVQVTALPSVPETEDSGTSEPAPDSQGEIPAWTTLDAAWGPYLAEREWGNPREAIDPNNGWSFTFEKAMSLPYRLGEDGIAGLTDQALSVAFSYAFYKPGEPYLTERLNGVDNPGGEYGEDILEERVFYENTPNHSYMRYGYSYPYRQQYSNAAVEYAKLDSQTLLSQVTLTGLENSSGGSLHLVPLIRFQSGGEVHHVEERVWDAAAQDGHFVVVAGAPPQGWQVSMNAPVERANINNALVRNGALRNRGSGNKAAWDFLIPLAPGEKETLRFGLAFHADYETALQAANQALALADELLAQRQSEALALFKDQVSDHADVYQAALMNLLWNKMYYAYDGRFQSSWRGDIDLRDIVLVPDKWEFPWPAMWDTCFQIKVALLADPEQSKKELRLYLSDRWQTSTGHIPNTEWNLMDETPPLFAWAAWETYQSSGERQLLQELFPRLEKHYEFVTKAYDRDGDSLHIAGFMGMDNIPRPQGQDPEQADLSGWVAFFARDMSRIARELGQEERAAFYEEEFREIQTAVNGQLWDSASGFYYDRDAQGFLLEKSYSGLIPFIAGLASPEQEREIVEKLKDPAQFWTPYGIRSLSADSGLYEPGFSLSGWKNSNWRGPVWMPINYLLVQRLEEVEPELADALRKALIENIEKQWRATGHFWEYYHAETGEGLGADHQTGWTALVANLIHEKYAR